MEKTERCLNKIGSFPENNLSIACPPQLPLGTRLEIRSEIVRGIFVCDDRGGAIKGRRVDIYMSDRRRALNFGRRTVFVRILED